MTLALVTSNEKSNERKLILETYGNVSVRFAPSAIVLTLEHCIRLGEQTIVGDCTVDVRSVDPDALDVTNLHRHIPVGSCSFASVRKYLVSPRRRRIWRVN